MHYFSSQQKLTRMIKIKIFLPGQEENSFQAKIFFISKTQFMAFCVFLAIKLRWGWLLLLLVHQKKEIKNIFSECFNGTLKETSFRMF